MITGGCFCGRVRYEVRGTPFNATLCHCRTCRAVSGAPTLAWFSCTSAELVLVAGAPRSFASSDGVTRGFCDACGTALTYARADLPDEIDVTIASLDAPDDVPPRDQTQHRHRIAWVDGLGGLPAHPDGRPAGRLRP